MCFAFKNFAEIYVFQKFPQFINCCIFENNILTVYELHVYEMLKFKLKSIMGAHVQENCNNMFSFKHSRQTGLPEFECLDELLLKIKFDSCSIKYWATKLYNTLETNLILPVDVGNIVFLQVKNFQ